jgi:peptidoglycan/LPS O-acetylase OafA/YrhL
MASPEGREPGERLETLDGLRGIAAAVVFLGHFALLWKPLTGGWLILDRKSPLYLLHSGHESVLLFFLLSGFVLALPYARGTPQSYPVFMVRRIFRIYFPYLVALGLALLGNLFFHGKTDISGSFAVTWAHRISPHAILQHVLFIGNYNSSRYNIAFWTLVYEMRISIVFPFLCLWLLRLPLAGALGIGVVFLLVDGLRPSLHVLHLFPFLYAWIFIFGVVLARCRQPLRAWIDTGPGTRSVVLMVSLALYLGAHLMSANQTVWDALAVAGAAGLIVLALGGNRFAAGLRSSFALFLGRISYSLYLTHGTVLFVIAYLGYGKVGLEWLFLAYVGISVPLACLFCLLIEEPSLRAGRRFSKRLFG